MPVIPLGIDSANFTYTTSAIATIPGSWLLLFGADPTRYGFGVFTISSQVYIWPGKPAPATQRGIYIAALAYNPGIQWITYPLWRSIVQDAWYINGSGSAPTVDVIQLFYRPGAIPSNLGELPSQIW